MKTELMIVAMTLMLTGGVLGQTSPPAPATWTVAGLPPDLRDALLRDAACEQTAEPASGEAARGDLRVAQVSTQGIRSTAGANVGVIVAFNDACHCHEANCGTYVYLTGNAGYKLAFSGAFSSLHPVRVFKRGYPSLSGKVQITQTKVESSVYDWNGKAYVPSLCATITQRAGQRVPAIVHHDCAQAPMREQTQK